jgi:hypothetical protein
MLDYTPTRFLGIVDERVPHPNVQYGLKMSQKLGRLVGPHAIALGMPMRDSKHASSLEPARLRSGDVGCLPPLGDAVSNPPALLCFHDGTCRT